MNKNRILSWESHLIVQATEGDPVAYDLLSDLYRPTLTHLAIRMLRNSEDAQDAVQDTLLKAFRALEDFDPSRPLKPWLCRICTNCCVDIIRSRQRESEPLEAYEHSICDPQNVALEAEDSILGGHVDEAIRRLPETYRQIVVMRHVNHMEVNEIAAKLDRPEGTIKSWLYRARAILRKDLQFVAGLM
ncbi:MAG: RNA polymerase sigma factor [Fimbriimonas sp.]